jgi:hypothetical protein
MTITADDEKELRKIIVRVQGKQYDDEETLSTVAERAYLLGRETAQKDIRRIAEVFGRMHEADGHAPFPASTDDLVRRAEELTRAENARGDALAALSDHRHAALLAAGIHGGPGAWRWRSDPQGTILDDAEAWERLLGEMREATAYREQCRAAMARGECLTCGFAPCLCDQQ